MNTAYVETAFHIGTRLAREAIWDRDRCNWLSPVYEDFTGEQQLGIGTLGPSLYDGTAGIAVFLASLYRVSGDAMMAGVAAAAIEHALTRAMDVPEAMQLGFYTGLLGIGYAATEVGRCLGRERLVARGLELVRHTLIIDGAAKSELDVMSGRAGGVPALLRLFALYGGDDLCHAAVAAGELLLSRATDTAHGLSWDTLGEMARNIDISRVSQDLSNIFCAEGRPHLTGLSHGAGGIGWALAELAAATGETRFRTAALRAFDYEDNSFDAARDSWPDLRQINETATEPATPAAWCHGAVGIGLARMRALEVLGATPGQSAAVRAALRITARSVIGQLAAGSGNYSLCHGLAGDVELFLLWQSISGDPQAQLLVDAIAIQGIHLFDAQRKPWPSGISGGGEAPGLMLGLAGTGYFYLRAADPTTPSILLVTPPKTTRAGAHNEN